MRTPQADGDTGRRTTPVADVLGPVGRPVHELPAAFVEGTAALVSIVDSRGRLLFANPALQRFTGRTGTDLVGRLFWEVYVVPEDVGRARTAVTQGLSTGQDFSAEGDWLDGDGRRRRVAMHVNVLVDGDRRPYAVACIGLDVTEQRLREAQLHARAHTDVLTGAGNRTVLFDALRRHLDPDGGGCGLLFCDLDGFKAVNDQHGHATGDQLLVDVAARLAELVGPGDLVARFGGDEFVLLCPQADAPALAALAARIETRVQEPFSGPAGPLRIGISIGCSLGRPGDSADDVVARADRGMYGVKVRRRPRSGDAGPGRAVVLSGG